MRPRVLFVGGTRYRLPLGASLGRKWDAIGAHLDYEVLATGATRSVDAAGSGFHLLAPLRPAALGRALLLPRLAGAAVRRLRARPVDVIVAESPHFGAAALVARALAPGPRPLVAIEVHGDWRTATRLYGSRARRLAGPLADGLARLALRHADGVRAISAETSRLVVDATGRRPLSVFATYTDLRAFTQTPPAPAPAEPVALFVGALEVVKGVDSLLDAWGAVLRAVPGARLVVIGQGRRQARVQRMSVRYPERVIWVPKASPGEVRDALDQARLLVLPSRSEGLGRVIVEAFARARPVVASRVGGITELVEHGRSGLLVEAGDTPALASALERLLVDEGAAAAMGAAARRRYEESLDVSAEAYAESYAEFVASTRGPFRPATPEG